jgi:hypothetical protein
MLQLCRGAKVFGSGIGKRYAIGGRGRVEPV